jgi:hypothetical protein
LQVVLWGNLNYILEVFDMKTILGVTTGLLVGVALGIAGAAVLCASDHHFMKFFAETCGYNYQESEEDEAK